MFLKDFGQVPEVSNFQVNFESFHRKEWSLRNIEFVVFL